MDSHVLEFLQISIYAPAGIVCQKGVGNPHLFQSLQERDGEGEERAPHINSAIHIQGHVAYATKHLLSLLIHSRLLLLSTWC